MGLSVSICMMGIAYSGHIKFEINQALYKAENQCIAKYVSYGVERKRIVRDNGTCFVKPLEY